MKLFLVLFRQSIISAYRMICHVNLKKRSYFSILKISKKLIATNIKTEQNTEQYSNDFSVTKKAKVFLCSQIFDTKVS